MSYYSRLSHAFEQAPILPLTPCSRYAIVSDCHRGNGSANDNFLKNQNLYLTALQHYYEKGFTYIELGDGDELWENRRMQEIIEVHSDVFRLLSCFYNQERLYMLYGNHDMEKKKPHYSKKVCATYFCHNSQCVKPLFPNLTFHHGLILKSTPLGHDLYLTHGHQVSLLNSTYWKLARFLVRYFWQPLEHFGVSDPTSAAKNYIRKDKEEKRLVRYSEASGHRLITGHTHRPKLLPSAPSYMNTGSCVHPSCITCLEIENGMISLVKWCFSAKKDRTLYVAREVLSQMSLFHSSYLI